MMTHDARDASLTPKTSAAEGALDVTATPRKLGMRKNFAWALIGNGVYGASIWCSFIILAKLVSAADVGRFALAMAICTPITAFAALNLKTVQVTDARDAHRFGHIFALQLTTATLSLLLIAGIALFGGHDMTTAGLIVVVGLGQLVVTTREVFLAFNQKHERMDTVAASKTILGIASLISLGMLTWASGNVIVGVAAMQAAKLAVFLFWDMRATGQLVRDYVGQSPGEFFRPMWVPDILLGVAWLALPLAFTQLLVQLTLNVPRYFIAGFLDEERLGYFAAIFTLPMAVMTMMHAAGMAGLPRLSRYYLHNPSAYVRLLFKLMAVALVLGLGGVLVALLAGRPLLTIVFTPEYADYVHELCWAMVYGLTWAVVAMVRHGVTAMRRFRIQPAILLVSLATVVATGFWLVPAYGLVGAVWSLILAKLVEGLLAALVIVEGVIRGGGGEDGSQSTGATAPAGQVLPPTLPTSRSAPVETPGRDAGH